MTQLHDIITELDAYAKKCGLEVSTVCRNATGNPRLRDRLIRRIERTCADIEALRKFMMDNPPSGRSTDGLACQQDMDAQTDKFKRAAE